jgi:hypothetical protein
VIYLTRKMGTSYSLIPCYKLLRQLVLLSMFEDILNQLRENGFKLLKCGGLRHVGLELELAAKNCFSEASELGTRVDRLMERCGEELN